MSLQRKNHHREPPRARDVAGILSLCGAGPNENLAAIVAVAGIVVAHPMKSKASGEIVEVEDAEAEWLLDVLEELFDFYYVGPAQAAARRNALNEKLSSLGKPPLKTAVPTS
jgi:hypothetical protein